MISFSVQLASAQGIIFSSGDFDDIVKQAKEQKKRYLRGCLHLLVWTM